MAAELRPGVTGVLSPRKTVELAFLPALLGAHLESRELIEIMALEEGDAALADAVGRARQLLRA